MSQGIYKTHRTREQAKENQADEKGSKNRFSVYWHEVDTWRNVLQDGKTGPTAAVMAMRLRRGCRRGRLIAKDRQKEKAAFEGTRGARLEKCEP